MTEYHITSISNGIHGHSTDHCDAAGCNGDQLYLGTAADLDLNDVAKGDVIEIPDDRWAVLDIRGESGRYGRIVSRHASQAEADRAMVDHARAQLGGSVLTADALPRLMWTIAEVSGKVGQRVRYEAVRR